MPVMSGVNFGEIQWGDVPTWILGAGAIVTAIYARLAFRKQSLEVKILGEQLKDQQEVTKQQAEAITVQNQQLEVQRKQFEQQQAFNEKQAIVADMRILELQALAERRKNEDTEQHRAQARFIFLKQHVDEYGAKARDGKPSPVVNATVFNTSDQPIYNVVLRWHLGTQPRGENSLGTVMPGNSETASKEIPNGANPDVFGAVALFDDAEKVCWRLREQGQLDEIPKEQLPRA
jgi:hypothetical protein